MMQLLSLDGAAGPAVPMSDAAASALVGGALDAVFGVPPVGGGGSAAGGSGVAAKAMMFAAAALVIGGAVVAWQMTRPAHELAIEVHALEAPTPVAVVEPDAREAGEPEIDAPIAEVEVVIPVHRPDVKKPAPEKAEDLLAAANAARAKKAWKDADGLYARVVDEHAGSRSAQVALVASATLHLEHLGDAAGAASRFRKALAGHPKGPVAEEARYGLAEAYKALGNDAGEAKALDDFLAHHPDSPLADRARKRRATLP